MLHDDGTWSMNLRCGEKQKTPNEVYLHDGLNETKILLLAHLIGISHLFSEENGKQIFIYIPGTVSKFNAGDKIEYDVHSNDLSCTTYIVVVKDIHYEDGDYVYTTTDEDGDDSDISEWVLCNCNARKI